jgi:hypothetical protein
VKEKDSKELKGILLSPPRGLTRSSSAQEVPTVSTIDANANAERPGNRRAATEHRVHFDENANPFARNARPAQVLSDHIVLARAAVSSPPPPEQKDEVSAANFFPYSPVSVHSYLAMDGLPSPVSPPDPAYIAQIEREMEEIMAMGYFNEPAIPHRHCEEQSLLSRQLSGVQPDPTIQPAHEMTETSTQDMTEEEKFLARVGAVRDWTRYPPIQVADGYIPESKRDWNWNGGERRGFGESPSAMEFSSTF